MSSTTPRKVLSSIFVTFCAVSVLVALVPLALVLFFVVGQGFRSVTIDFFLQTPKPVGEPGGGMGNAIAGTLMLSGLAAIMAVPLGVGSGVLILGGAGGRVASLGRGVARPL